MKLEQRMIEISKEIKNVIIVLQGFQDEQSPMNHKYFSFNIKNIESLDIKDLEEKVIEEIISNRGFTDEYKWMTMEEYQLFKSRAEFSKNTTVVLRNNLYDRQFPYVNTLADIETAYRGLYYKEDESLDQLQTDILEKIAYFYGKLDYSKNLDKYYITFPELDSNIKIFNFYEKLLIEDIKLEDGSDSDGYVIELSENEIQFLDMLDEIKNKNISEVITVVSGDINNLPYQYLERLSILHKHFGTNIRFIKVNTEKRVIKKEKEYLEILERIYGYENYKEIEFYKNIENRCKETTKISQMQIIDDIVNQAELALDGQMFRDIYITASTGAGKSVMFQIPALYLAETNNQRPLTIVISPLIGLMNDQVDTMRRKGINTLATINGNTPPFEKEQIIEKVQNGEVDVLYLSPETLQARSDIKMLIGERNIGIVIIDEAHIVTTWGKSFRADYWYLGIYLAKLRKEYKFPIVTFTATAIYGGREDMYLDTRNSLNMVNPISYFGSVRREDIAMCVRSNTKELDLAGKDYRNTKNLMSLKHLRRAYDRGEKSLIYFPTIKLLREFNRYIEQNDKEIAECTGQYYGSLEKEIKDEVLSEFKNGDMKFVLATKAFGMGIDIPDITNVYHYSPTGNIVDYIQEIGRAARNKSLVPCGYAWIDYLQGDLNEIKRLNGMSAIKKSQILDVMQKVLNVYKEKGNNRNLLVSAEDFKHIFVQNKKDEDNLDNKVKTVMLMIEKDFSSPNKIGYSPFVARPRSLFGNDLLFVTNEFIKEIELSRLKEFFNEAYKINSSKYKAVYQVNLAGIWETYYKTMSYPSFKYSIHTDEGKEKFKDRMLFSKFVYATGIEVTTNYEKENILVEYIKILKCFEQFVDQKKMYGQQFTASELGVHIMSDLKMANRFEAIAFSQTIINAAFELNKIKNIKIISERANSNENNQRYIIHQDGNIFTDFIGNAIKDVLGTSENRITSLDGSIIFDFRSKSECIDTKISALGIGDSYNLLSYQLLGGGNPQIYIRMNSVYPLEQAISQGDYYKNHILSDVQMKHYIGVEMFKYLFTTFKTESKGKEKALEYTRWFWDNIEDYFMGILPDEVEAKMHRTNQL